MRERGQHDEKGIPWILVFAILWVGSFIAWTFFSGALSGVK